MENNMIGRRFGKLLVTERMNDRIYLDGSREEMYKCKCNCGGEITVSRKSLELGLITHCGCKMPGKLENLAGQRFGKLVVLDRADDFIDNKGNRYVQWRCKCDCGNEKIIRAHSLKTGHTTSCGCAQIEATKTHGDTKSREYDMWKRVRRRFNVIPEWEDYETFKKWLISIGGIQNDKYIGVKDESLPCGPDNFVWKTMKEITYSRNNTVPLTYKGVTKSISGWADYLGVNPATLFRRYNSGWTPEEIIETPVGNNIKKVEYNGKEYTLKELEEITGISESTLYDRIFRRGWDVEKALTKVASNERQDIIEYNGDAMKIRDWERIRGYNRNVISRRINTGTYTFAEAINGKQDSVVQTPKNAIYFMDDNGNYYSQKEWEIKENGGKRNASF